MSAVDYPLPMSSDVVSAPKNSRTNQGATSIAGKPALLGPSRTLKGGAPEIPGPNHGHHSNPRLGLQAQQAQDHWQAVLWSDGGSPAQEAPIWPMSCGVLSSSSIQLFSSKHHAQLPSGFFPGPGTQFRIAAWANQQECPVIMSLHHWPGSLTNPSGPQGHSTPVQAWITAMSSFMASKSASKQHSFSGYDSTILFPVAMYLNNNHP